ncbi:contact-dependent growth inhibition system immunity protein [Streptomyces sp. NPDC056333]|uniref:contact-dependent growth inhibition system immunity protein n=1 Tax=Streptomyces sp. NPDC056333 TaxID=3345786 RepID=UPI0035D7767C
MRLLTGQNEGLPYLLPPASKVLRPDPMTEGHMYEGDLPAAVPTRSPETWSKSPPSSGVSFAWSSRIRAI